MPFDDARSVLTTWLDRLNAGRVDEVLALYDETASLMPTFSSELLRNAGALRGYFDGLATSDALSVTLEEDTLLVQPVAGKTAALSGIYRWRFIRSGREFDVRARFTYVVDFGAERPILHHHSSALPENL